VHSALDASVDALQHGPRVMTDRSRARAARRARTSAWLALLLYAWTSAWCGLHAALEPHEVCAHGEWTHAEDGCEPALLEPSGEAPLVLAPLDEHGSAAGHGHCGILGRERLVESASVRHVVGEFRAARRARPARVSTTAASSVPLLALAPHHGPPAV
jgi:hypothetical protein